ncbi:MULTISPECIES: flippase [Haloferax]|uniref:Oligosaccharide flippase family protein n=2 Tax=Haloferax TaxID=2251 RepID=A0A6G1Z0Q6_9EURY|nr:MULTISPECIES: flippase [Haloferax]KAB1187517.1 flippase [Haloferax sp. CBA1149]MRW80169.1 oligosaccharide flippase family protein [Haloferax marinisediminis]
MSDGSSRLGSLALSSGTLLFGRIFGKLANVAGLALLTRELTSSNFGVVMLAYTISSVIGLICVCGIPNGLASLLPRLDGKRKIRVLLSGISISIAGGLIGSTLLVFFRKEISMVTSEPQLTTILVPFAAFGFLFGLSKSVTGVLRGYKLSTEATLSRDIIAESLSLAFLVFWFLSWESFEGVYVYWWLIPITSILVGSVLFLRKISELPFSFPQVDDYKYILDFSWPLTIESGFVVLMSNIDVILIGVFLTSTPVGIYKAAQPIAMSMVIILTSFTFLYLPLASEMYENGELKELNNLYKICTKWIITFSIPLTTVIIAYSETILSTVYQQEFAAGATALSILTIGVFLRTFFGPNGAMIKAISKTTVDLYASVASLLTNLCLNLFLIPRIGMVGAAIATATGFTVFNLIEVVVTYKSVKMQPISKENIQIILTVIIFGGVARQFLGDTVGSLFLFSLLVGIVSLISSLVVADSTEERRLTREFTTKVSEMF